MVNLKPQLYVGRRNLRQVQYFEPPEDSPRRLAYKPEKGGLWTSTYTPRSKHQSDWLRWCYSENFGYYPKTGFVIRAKSNARVFKIDSYQDLVILIQEFNPKINKTKSIWESNYFLAPLQFEKIQKKYDILHLTQKGLIDTWDMDKSFSLHGWDVESCLWLNCDSIDTIKLVEINYPPKIEGTYD